ncbi:hypothetical protein N9I68_01720 [Bacteroidia bacterium]|nr:hypothetical protein [Bacteroidia bacterium]
MSLMLIGCKEEEKVNPVVATSFCDNTEVMITSSDSANVYMATNAEWNLSEFWQEWIVEKLDGEFVMSSLGGTPSFDLHISYGLKITDTLNVCVDIYPNADFYDRSGEVCTKCKTISFNSTEWVINE